MPWNENNVGTYFISTEDRGWCQTTYTAFFLISKIFERTIGSLRTTYTNPIQDTVFPGRYVFGPWFSCTQYLLATNMTVTKFFVPLELL
jgi:hypothetical protein